MRASIAFFAGAGTMVAAIATGLGGGLLMANILSPREAQNLSNKLERHAASQEAQQSPQPNAQQALPPAAAASNEPQDPVPHPTPTPATATMAARLPSPPQPSTQSGNPARQAPSKETANETAKETAKKAAKETAKEATTTNEQPARVAPSKKSAERSANAPASEQREKSQERQASAPVAPPEPSSSPDSANAKASDADVKRQAAQQRKADRHQRWATGRQQHEQEMRDAERTVRDDSDGRAVIRERDHDRPRFFDDSDRPRDFGGPIDFPHFNLFGPD